MAARRSVSVLQLMLVLDGTPHTSFCTPAARFQKSSRVPCLRNFVSLHLHRAPDLHASMRSRRYTYTALHISTPPCLHIATPVASLQSSTPPCHHIATPTSQHLHRASRVPYLHTTPMSLHLQGASRSSYFHGFVLPRLHRASRPPSLYPSRRSRFATLSRRTACGGRANPAFRATRAHSIKPHQNFTPARLQYASKAPERASQAPELHTSTSAHLQRLSRPPELRTSTSRTPTARLQSSRASFLHTYTRASQLPSSIR